jgi:tRNA threonylcarbamoyladenosine modification (KEOPS) complex  Pcc1 subunit
LKGISLSAEIRVDGDRKTLAAMKAALLESKDARIRGTVSLEKSLVITVESPDATALRAGLNTYLRILQSVGGIPKGDY